MADIMDVFKGIIVMQLFYAVAITLIAIALPASALNYVSGFSDAGTDINVEGVATDVQDSLETQTDIPVIELGALVFYSGNILIDLLVNFVTAIPQMIMLLVNGVMMLFGNGIDALVILYIELFASVMINVMYFIGLMQLLTGIRSGRLV